MDLAHKMRAKMVSFSSSKTPKTSGSHTTTDISSKTKSISASVSMPTVSMSRSSSTLKSTKPQTVLVISAAEDVVAALGSKFVQDHAVRPPHKPLDQNMPRDGPFVKLKRASVQDTLDDPCLTVFGVWAAQLVGDVLRTKLRGRNVKLWFSSPELRCIQTMCALFDGTRWGKDCVGYGGLVQNGLCAFYDTKKVPHFVNHSSFDAVKRDRPRGFKVNWKYHNGNGWWSESLDGPECYRSAMTRFTAAASAVINRVSKWNQAGAITVVCLPPSSVPNFLSFACQGRAMRFENYEVHAKYLSGFTLAISQLDYANGHWEIVEPLLPQFSWRKNPRLDYTLFKPEPEPKVKKTSSVLACITGQTLRSENTDTPSFSGIFSDREAFSMHSSSKQLRL